MAPLQADVQVTTLTQQAARSALEHPIEVKAGEVRNVTITIPLMEKNSYLVVKLPSQIVAELMKYAKTLPEASRSDFLIDWVMKNQQAVLEQFLGSGGRLRPFRYDVVPVLASPLAGATPKRTSETKPKDPYYQEGHILVEQIHVWNPESGSVPFGWPGSVPQGWRAPDKGELPQEVLTRANYFQPKYERGKIPLGEARVEEFDGKKYMYMACYHSDPPPSHTSITVLVPDEGQLAEAKRPAPSKGKKGPVQEKPPLPVFVPQPGPAPKAPVKRELPPLPAEIKGGDGHSKKTAYLVYSAKPYPGEETTISIPLGLDIEGVGVVHFVINFKASQLAKSKLQETLGELRKIVGDSIYRYAAETDKAVEHTALRSALNKIPATISQSIQQISAQDPDLANYLDKH